MPLTDDELKLALDRFRMAEEAESQSRRDALDDWQFSIGNQWSADIQTQRTSDGRPCLTMDHIGPAMKLITNEQRQQRPAGQVNPVGEGSNKETAEILEGMVRHIEVISDAEIAYDQAFDHMMRGGFGFWRLVTEYVDDTSFDQEIKIKPVQNPFAVHFDPFSVEPDHIDADFAFVFEDIPREEYKRQWPDSEVASLEDFNSVGDMRKEWFSKDTVRVADYFHVEYERSTLEKDGKKRDILKRRIIWSKINAIEELEQTEWPGKWIPLIPVYGIDVMVNGQRYLAGMVRGAKDPQRMYNYWASSMTEAIALAPKAPWVVAEGQLEGHENQWAASNVRTMATLTYKQVDVGGKPAPPPQRNSVEPPIQAMVLALNQADRDLKSSTLIYDPSLGDNPKDQSGKAITALQRQGQVGNINWTDNLSRSIRHSVRAILDLIPHIYDTPRIQRIINPDGTTDHVGIYNSQAQGQPDAHEILMQQGMEKVFDVGVGTYDVVVNAGPSFQTKRQEALASQIALIAQFPQIMPIAGDIMVRNFDWPQADEIADRLKKSLPPQLQDQDDPNANVQQLQQQLAQFQQQHAELTARLNQATQIIETKQIEGDYKVKLALIDERVKIAVAEINASKDRDKFQGEKILAELEMGHDAAHEVAMAAVGHSQNQQMAQQAQMAAAQQPQNGSSSPTGAGA